MRIYESSYHAEKDKDNIKERYIVVEESASAHCCFGYSVIDIEKINFAFSFGYAVCETFEKDDAILICNLLNKK